VKIKIIDKRRNELLKRLEVKFRVDHEKSGTPTRLQIRQGLAGILDVDEEKIYVKKIETKTGTNIAFGKANIYDSLSQAEYVEPKYIVLRNKPKTEGEKEE